MLRLHYADNLNIESEVNLPPEASHHLVNVMRAKVDDEFIIFNESGEFIARILRIDKKTTTIIIVSQRECKTESACNITLLQALTRRERMDYSIQKATELGVQIIQPVITEHCVVKLDQKRSLQRIKHWQGIAQHASEQSGRLKIPEIKPILKLDVTLQSLSQNNTDLKLIFALAASQPLSAIKHETAKDEKKDIYLALGPAGGFSVREVSLAQECGFKSIKLGPRILRAETATTAALTAIQLRWGDLDT